MSYDDPNFTILTSGGCNSFCSFCTDPMKRKASPDYMHNMVKAIQTLPSHFDQVSISGGEPTISPDLYSILWAVKMSGKFRKVVLTTNGTKLMEHYRLIRDTINHLNVSRHAIGTAENEKIFGTKEIISDTILTEVSQHMNKAGIDVNLNHVYGPNSKHDMHYVVEYVKYARSVGATSVSFRYDQNENSLEPTYLEQIFSDWKQIHQGGCPVCRNHTVLVSGMPVVFKASFAEPSKAIADVYELIYHITGKLTTDWDGKTEFTKAMADAYVPSYRADPHKQHDVVKHTVAVPVSPPRGSKAPPPATKVVLPKKVIPIRQETITGTHGCGGLGGGGGSWVHREEENDRIAKLTPKPSKKLTTQQVEYGGGCGGFGGGCGR